jgi:subtilisin family serine protease
MAGTGRLLLRFRNSPGAAVAATAIAPPAIAGLDLEPLFDTGGATRGTALGIAPADSARWYLSKSAGNNINPWDLAHDAYERHISNPALAAAAGSLDFIEPDLVQDWPYQSQNSARLAAADEDACAFEDQNPDRPMGPGFAWHLQDAFSQLASARAKIAPGGATIRIAHLDVGYDPNHETFPHDRVELALQRNFIDDDRPNNAEDLGVTGMLKNPGHGTGTLSILAGARFQFENDKYQFDDILGGASLARIVPVRVGNSVIQINTSSVAKGIAYVADLCADPATAVHVISMSMGGVASNAWADAVNKVYEAGIVFVAAAGNNISSGLFGFPTRYIVYPGRFRRVIGACGIMANRQPYYDLPAGVMQGNWGPASKMATVVSAYTPNISWAKWHCEQITRMSGEGTSSATPQVAAAAALYLQLHAGDLLDSTKYPQPWMRVEAVRRALFLTADRTADGGRTEKLGNGILRAADALAFAPPAANTLQMLPTDSASFAFLNALFGTGIAAATPQDRMLQLEATQLSQRWGGRSSPNPVEEAVPDPDLGATNIDPRQVRRYLEALLDHPDASVRLKNRVKDILGGSSSTPTTGKSPPPAPSAPSTTAAKPLSPPKPGSSARSATVSTKLPPPPYRRLRGYAFDPSVSSTLTGIGISQVTFKLPWEKLEPGPVSEYLEVIDIDPPSQTFYNPVDLDHPMLLAQDGLPPDEGNPQFHQQMAYAVARTTIRHFEQALGRRIFWRPGPPAPNQNPEDDSHFVPRLRIYPHALREMNAYYSPQKIALLLGYFQATADDPGDHMPGGQVFACLSHDIVAHECTHALLDGMHRRFIVPSNRDVLAFHEGFADCVALLQHFTYPEIVRYQIAEARGQIDTQETLLSQLAVQFGRSTGLRGALRDAIGTVDRNTGQWTPHKPDPAEYQSWTEPHERGSILVAAVFDAFLAIYRRRTADLLRIATSGSGILAPGSLHPDLVNRLAAEAAKSAHHVLGMCIRALDYCPPTDITFGEYLRAVITADYDVLIDDDLEYRLAFIDAFRRRGIYPQDVPTMSVESLLWSTPANDQPTPSRKLDHVLEKLRDYAASNAYASTRQRIFELQRKMRRDIHEWLVDHFLHSAEGPADAAYLGINPSLPFEVHTARFADRSGPDGGSCPQVLIGLLQRTQIPASADDPTGPKIDFEGGTTIVANLRNREIGYCIRKSLSSASRQQAQQAFMFARSGSLGATYLGNKPAAEPFAIIHRCTPLE